MTNYLVNNCHKCPCDKKRKDKTKDLIVTNDDIKLEISTPAVSVNKVDTDIMDDDKTIKAFEELVKTLQITQVSELYSLLIKTNHTKFVNHTSISDIVCEVFMSVFKTTPGINNLVNNNYLSIFKLLKRILIDTGASKSIIKCSYMSSNIYNANKKVSNIYS